MSDDVIHVPQPDEPDGEWYDDDWFDAWADDYDDDFILYDTFDEPPIPDGEQCSECSHFIKASDDELVFSHEGYFYCEDCYDELGLYPSEDLDNWPVDIEEE